MTQDSELHRIKLFCFLSQFISSDFQRAAVIVLLESEEPLSIQEITDIALANGVLTTKGKTPAATMQSLCCQNDSSGQPYDRLGLFKYDAKTKKLGLSGIH